MNIPPFRSLVNLRRSFFYAVAASLAISSSSQAQAILDFNFTHGTAVTDQYKSLYGVTISAISLPYEVTNSDDSKTTIDPNDVAVVFDTERTGTTSDPDLQRTGYSSGGWSGGNLDPDYVIGGALILPENDDLLGSDLYSDPDDNVAGGTFSFEIDADRFYSSFSTILVDFEEGGSAWDLRIVGRNGVIQTLSYEDVLTPGNALYDSSVASGDNFVNRLPLIDVTNYGIDYIDRLDVILNQSSGAIGEIIFDPKETGSIPEPTSSMLILVAGAGFVLRRRR